MSESNGYLSPYIGDGFDLEGEIPELPGRYSAVKIRYRPLSADEESLIFSTIRQQPAESVTKIYAATFAGTREQPGNLRAWDLKDHKGNKVEITAENIGRLAPPVFDALKCLLDGTIVLPSGETQAETDAKN